MRGVLEWLLITLEVRLEAFALLDVRRGHRLHVDPGDAVLLHHVLSGSGWLEVPGHAPVRCEPGTVIFAPAGADQRLRIDEDDEGEEITALENCAMVKDGLIRFDAAPGGDPDLRVVSASMLASADGSFGLFDALKAPLTERHEGNERVAGAFALLRREAEAPGLGTRAFISSLMQLCLLALIRRHFEQLPQDSPLIAAFGDRRLARALAAVLDAPADAHSVASLAATAGMSRSAFARTFRTDFDLSPMEFVAKVRLQHAAELLRGTDLPVKSIATSIGYASRSHFSRAFRAAYGRDPRSFRRHASRATEIPHLDPEADADGEEE